MLYWLTLAISKRQRRKALSLTAYTAVLGMIGHEVSPAKPVTES